MTKNILALIGLITVFEIAEPPVRRAYYWVSHKTNQLLEDKNVSSVKSEK